MPNSTTVAKPKHCHSKHSEESAFRLCGQHNQHVHPARFAGGLQPCPDRIARNRLQLLRPAKFNLATFSPFTLVSAPASAIPSKNARNSGPAFHSVSLLDSTSLHTSA